MKVIGFAGYSGAGKTTLVERLIPELKQRGLRVSVVKHAHHKFDIDHPGKDSWRHRRAGAFEVVVASDQRLALVREFEQPAELSVHQLIAELHAGVDWVLVEGFKHSDLPKIEVLRYAAHGDAKPDMTPSGEGRSGAEQSSAAEPTQAPRPALYPLDHRVYAIATDAPEHLPAPTGLPVLDLNDAAALARWLVDSGERFDYNVEFHG